MSFLKNNKLKIGFTLILLLSISISFYCIWNVHRNTSTLTNHFSQQAFQGGNHFPQQNQSHQPTVNNQSAVPNQHGANASGKGNMPFSSANRPMGGGMVNSSGKYGTDFAIYSVGFFALATFLYFLIGRNKIRIAQTNKRIIFWSLLGTGFFLRLAVAPYAGGHMDLSLFENWASTAAKGLSGFYTNGNSDYPPLYIYVLYLVGKIASITGMNNYFNLLIKLPAILADTVTAYLIYKIGTRQLSTEISLMLAIFYLFNPAIIINSTFWGQVDSFFTLLIVLAIYLLQEKKWMGSVVMFTVAVLMKPQGIIFLPVLFFELLKLKSIKKILMAAAAALVTAIIIILPFSLNQDPLWIFSLYSKTLGEYPFASVNAFNFFSLIGANYKQDSATWILFSYHRWGMIFIVLVTAFSWFIYLKGDNSKLTFVAALIQIAGVFTFSSGMHERYLFPAAALSLIAYIYLKDKRLLWLSAGFSVTIFMNTYAIFYGSFNGMQSESYTFTLFLTSLLNVMLFIFMVKIVWDLGVKNKHIEKMAYRNEKGTASYL
ncbi:glycosyltransferase family 39 protein [Bacillus sp. BRMEA1]|uniref:glycosyltransferase family 39 protein n=1 Tax=Neobacillus endophyticus TaxID=2738405 RepID=UPI001565480E|nr:glycosyltransferase family 39 protein [Neobacillus endophyticus]NRD79739.1 glycosyltransferase family 39 protein [Neobacillus endophyticus]